MSARFHPDHAKNRELGNAAEAVSRHYRRSLPAARRNSGPPVSGFGYLVHCSRSGLESRHPRKAPFRKKKWGTEGGIEETGACLQSTRSVMLARDQGGRHVLRDIDRTTN